MRNVSDGFDSILNGKRVATTTQADGAQEGHILSVNTSTKTAYVTMTKSVFGTDTKFGPLPYCAGVANPPNPGDRVLVCFVGNGISRGWIISWHAEDSMPWQ
jgi:hypothetical protein